MDDDVDFDGPAPDETTKKPDDKAKPKVDAKKPPQEAAAPPAPADTQKPDATAKPPEPGPQRTTPQLPSPAEPHRIAEALQAEAPALIEHLAANDFVMTKEDIEALETDMPAALSKFAAKVYHKMAVNMMNQLARTIPAMTSQMAEQRERTQKRQSEFYKAWPDLNPEKHGALVNRYARIYRDANPSATFEQMVQDLGPMVMIGAKVVPGSSQQPVQPQAAPTRTNGRPPSPFRPAMGGPASPPKQADDNEWAGMASSADDE